MAKKEQTNNIENKNDEPILDKEVNLEQSPQCTEAEIAVNENVLNQLTHQDLLVFKNFSDIVYSFYDNEMKVYGGEFGVNDVDRYREASMEASKYLKLKELIFREIKNRTDILYEKTLV